MTWAAIWPWNVWPTPWQVETVLRDSPFPPHPMVPIKVRTNRFTGERQIESSGGKWVPYYVT